MSETILRAENLSKIYTGRKHLFSKHQNEKIAVDHVSLEIKKRQSVGLVGELGCGKSTVARAVLNLIPMNGGRVDFYDTCLYDVEKGIKVSQDKMQKLRRQMQIVFQDPSASLDPTKNIEQIMQEGIKKHNVCDKKDIREYCVEALSRCGLEKELMMRYPHELSGGQKQRVSIARSFALNPQFIACDELTAALDVSVQSQILNLLLDLKEKNNLTYLFISHNLEIVRYFCDELYIMYLGNIVEKGKCKDLYQSPLHPYTRLLLNSIPANNPSQRKKNYLTGVKQRKTEKSGGCCFFHRCPYAESKCLNRKPVLTEVDSDRQVACMLYE